MRNGRTISVIIPALDEREAIGRVIADIPDWVDDVIVADNGSTDGTDAIAAAAGARVVHEPRRGYGSACLTAMAALNQTDVVVFDGDYSDHPEDMPALVDPIVADAADMVIGSRVLGQAEARGALTITQRFGNWLSCSLVRLGWRVRYTDLGPFRAIRWDRLQQLRMQDPDYGWTVEMQVKAAQQRLRVVEVPVRYRPRIGQSEVSGTLRGVWGAGTKILYTIFAAAVSERRLQRANRRRGKLIVPMRYPEPGRVKTRLIPTLGPEGAAALHAEITRHTLNWARALRNRRDVDVEIRFDGGTESAMRGCFGDDFAMMVQGSGDLGERMGRAACDAFAKGHTAVVMVGTDCPEITADLAHAAFEALRDHDVVVGPAHDGGYYLIGLRDPAPMLFERINWGTDVVLKQTRTRAKEAQLKDILLETLHDVDRPEDLAVWERLKRQTNR